MPRYDFRCPRCGITTETHPMAQVPATSTCPLCADPTTRVFTATGLSHSSSPAMRLIDATRASASEPRVVTQLPTAAAPSVRPTTRDPRLARLPRP